MPTAPTNPFDSLSIPAVQLYCRMGNVAGLPADGKSTDQNLQVISVRRSANGEEQDYAVLRYKLEETDERVVDFSIEEGVVRQVDVYANLNEVFGSGSGETLVFWGELVEEQSRVGRGEEIFDIPKICNYHFGSRLYGPVMPKAGVNSGALSGDETTQRHGPILFNPEIDGIVVGNRSAAQLALNGLNSLADLYLWIEPESMRTANAVDYQDPINPADTPNPDKWGLTEAVWTLLWSCNPDETFIQNPWKGHLENVFNLLGNFGLSSTERELVNVKLRNGGYLPELLDELLIPRGFGWYVKPIYSGGGPAKANMILFFQYGRGPEVTLRMQRPGETLSPLPANLDQLEIATDIGNIANTVVAFGGYIEREVTIELKRGWPADKDSLSYDVLTESTGDQFEDNKNVWRLWVGNEAGDYNFTRPPVLGKPWLTIDGNALDLTDVFVDWLPQRLQMHDCLTQYPESPDPAQSNNGAARRRQPFVEWQDPAQGNAWKPLPGGWGEVLLENQIGIYFGADEPPRELIEAGEAARIRITGTLRSDMRLTATAAQLPSSPNPRQVELFLDVSDRFFDRQVETTGDHRSVLEGLPTADERDDTDKIVKFVEDVREIEDAANLTASFRIPGIHLEYEIGNVITKIDGRNIVLNRKTPTADTQLFLQIMSIELNCAEQWTELRTQGLHPGVRDYDDGR
jgi:hypothetical protein